MTLGEKIKKYRQLKGLTQKQLGEKVGFKKSTADVRINQYETNKMAPKADIREAIANALDIDLAAISDINLRSYEDIMYVLFEFEEKLGMTVENQDGKTCLIFDDNNKDISQLISFINLWKDQKAALIPDDKNASVEQENNYQIWKSRFVTNVNTYFEQKKSEIDKSYADLVAQIKKTVPHATKTSEISLLFRSLIEAGFTIATSYRSSFSNYSGPEFTFIVRELLNPPSEKAKELFAQFLSEVKHFKELGTEVFTNIELHDNNLTITYFIPISSFSIIKLQVDDVLQFYKNKNKENDYYNDTFETQFKIDLESHFNYIENEIQLFSTQIQNPK